VTYSIVARDAETGALGVAVQTCWFAVGAVVPWARAGVGAVATQASSEKAYGSRCLTAMAEGHGAASALAAARAADPGSAMRQVGVIDAAGGVANFTGELCIAYAGDCTGADYAVQANMMASPDVWPAMAAAYGSASGPFAQRLLAALVAAEAAGGDARGAMSAAMKIVDAQRRDDPTEGVLVDIRVDEHARPLDELARLLTAADAFDHYSRAERAIGTGDFDAVRREIDAAHELMPAEENILFLRAGSLFLEGRIEEGRAAMSALIDARPSWATILRSFGEKGIVAMPPGLSVEDLLGPATQ
jgi:uncharacterized Ntn-hydrolase superfamily protein